MTNPYPQPRRLLRSKSNRVLGGVCGGLAQYLNMDPTLVRILTVLISLFTGVPVVLYIVALFLVPEEGAPGTQPAGYPSVPGPVPQDAFQQPPFGAAPPPPPAAQPATPAAAPQPAQGHASAEGADDTIWGTEGPPWEQRSAEFSATTGAGPEPSPAGSHGTVPAHEADAEESAPEPAAGEATETAGAEPDRTAPDGGPDEGRDRPAGPPAG